MSGWFCECLDDARFNEGQASEEAQHPHELRELGLNVVADSPCVIAHGEKKLKQLIDSTVREALCKSYDDCEADEWLALLHEPLQTKNAPHDSA